jgi:hypothetical protein
MVEKQILSQIIHALSLLMIEEDILRQINFEDLIKDFANNKCRRKLFKV